MVEAVECGATEVCLQGGIHPDFDGDYYLGRRARGEGRRAGIHVHGFTALEVTEGARRLDMPLRDYLRARQGGRPGHARPAPPPRSSTTRCGRSSAPTRSTPRSGSTPTAPRTRSGLRSNVTIMFGHVERPEHVARHLVRTRALQKETGGFTEFVPLPFVHMATPIYLQRKARTRTDDARGAAHPRGRAHRATADRSTTCRSRG